MLSSFIEDCLEEETLLDEAGESSFLVSRFPSLLPLDIVSFFSVRSMLSADLCSFERLYALI